MSENNKLLGLIGICRISSSLEPGEERCEAAVKSGKACLVILSEDASGNTVKKFTDKCSFYQVTLKKVPLTKDEMGKAAGLNQRSCMAVTNEGLAAKMTEVINQMMGE